MTDSADPQVSVIIPAYNRAAFIADAIGSILGQTLRDLEVIVVDDGSTDDTAAVVDSIADRRVRLVQHGQNRGIPHARNTGLDAARGRFIAWLDSDDLARPHRLETQVRFLKAHPTMPMVGCCAGRMDASGAQRRGARVPPLAAADIGAWLLFRSAFQQSSITGRAQVLRRFRFDPGYPVCEDLDVFVRLSRSYPLCNLPEVLIDRRMHEGQSIRSAQEAIRTAKHAIFTDALDRLGLTFSEADVDRHIMLGHPKGHLVDRAALDWSEAWLRRMREANARTRHVEPDGLRLATSYFWVLACLSAMLQVGRMGSATRMARSPLAPGLLGSEGRAWLARAIPLMIRAALRIPAPRSIRQKARWRDAAQ